MFQNEGGFFTFTKSNIMMYFDQGETFSGVDYETGLEAVEKITNLFPDQNLVTIALKWILMHNEIGCVIPGVSKIEQLPANLAASESPELSPDQMDTVKEIYDTMIRPQVHQRW